MLVLQKLEQLSDHPWQKVAISILQSRRHLGYIQCSYSLGWIRTFQVSQFGAIHPARQVSHVPGGPKVGAHVSQFFPTQPVLHLLHSPGGSKLLAHSLQFCPAHPMLHEVHCPGGVKFSAHVRQSGSFQPRRQAVLVTSVSFCRIWSPGRLFNMIGSWRVGRRENCN